MEFYFFFIFLINKINMNKIKNNIIIILFGIIILINTSEIIYRVSNTDRFEEDEYLINVLQGKEKLNEPWIEINSSINVHYKNNFFNYGYFETPFLTFRFLSFLISIICSYFIKLIIDSDSIHDYLDLTYCLIWIILINSYIIGILIWCFNIVRIFVFLTNQMLNLRFKLKYKDEVLTNGVYCLICDIIIFIVICVNCCLIDFKIPINKNENIEISDIEHKKISSSDSVFHEISSNENSTITTSNKIEIEELK